MSSYERMNARDAGNDVWHVLLGNGEVRPMSLDTLDALFQEGVVTELTPILPPNATVWTRVGVAAGLDASDRESPDATRIVPSPAGSLVAHDTTRIIPRDAGRIMPMTASAVLPVVATRRAPPRVPSAPAPARASAMGGGWVALALALILLLGLGVGRAVRSHSRSLAAATSSLTATEALRAPDTLGARETHDTSAAAPAVIVSQVVAPQTVDAHSVAANAKQTRVVGDKAHDVRDVPKAKDRVLHPGRHGRRAKSGGSPFVNGGDKFDPLNASL